MGRSGHNLCVSLIQCKKESLWKGSPTCCWEVKMIPMSGWYYTEIWGLSCRPGPTVIQKKRKKWEGSHFIKNPSPSLPQCCPVPQLPKKMGTKFSPEAGSDIGMLTFTKFSLKFYNLSTGCLLVDFSVNIFPCLEWNQTDGFHFSRGPSWGKKDWGLHDTMWIVQVKCTPT